MDDFMDRFIGGMVDTIELGYRAFLSLPTRVVYKINTKITRSDFIWKYRVIIGSAIWAIIITLGIYILKAYFPLNNILGVIGVIFIIGPFAFGSLIWMKYIKSKGE